MFELVFLSGARAGAILPVVGVMRAGRSHDCSVEVPDPNVSRNHGEFRLENGHLHYIDLGSSNGSYHNERRTGGSELKHGDLIRLGETRMRVQRTDMRRQSSSVDSMSSVFGIREDEGSDSAPDLSQSMSIAVMRPPEKPNKKVQHSGDNIEDRMQAMMWVAEQLATISDLGDLYQPILDTLFEVFPHAERGFLMLGSTVDSLVPQAMKLRHGSSGDSSISSSLCNEALKRKEVLIYTEGDDQGSFDQGISLISLNIRSAMVAPLLVQEEALGLLVVDTSNRRKQFSKTDMELAAAVCHQIAVAIKHHQTMAELIKQQGVRDNLSRFLPKPVVDQALRGQVDVKLGGERYDTGTVLFADVVGFTKLSESLSPEEIVRAMNRFFDRMVNCIEEEQGAIDKFMGDCIMAFWGIPFSDSNSGLHAISAGLTMNSVLAGLNHLAVSEGDIPFGITIGAEFGPMVAGNIGSENHMNYTVLGNTVNTSQRIQSQAGPGQMLVGESLWHQVENEAIGVAMPPVMVKNKSKPVSTFSIRGLRSGGEIILHIPGQIHGRMATLIRRLSDGIFVMLHEPDNDVNLGEFVSLLPELNNASFGEVSLIAGLPIQDGDGGLTRSQVTLEDGTLGGLLGDDLLQCDIPWQEMRRSTITQH